MKTLLAIFCFSLSIGLLTSCSNGTDNNNEDSVDSARAKNESMPAVKEDASDFLTKAASGGKLEVQLGQMAQQKAVNQRVKDFGMMMVHDHTKSGEELKALAQQKGITLPQTLSDAHQKHFDELQKQNGKDWDKAYIDLMQSDHKGDIDEFTKASEKIEDPTINGFAKKTIPILQMHLDSVKAIKEGLKD